MGKQPQQNTLLREFPIPQICFACRTLFHDPQNSF